jgi:hypothetical protein
MMHLIRALKDLDEITISRCLAISLGWEVYGESSEGICADKKAIGSFNISNWSDIMPIAVEHNVFFEVISTHGLTKYKASQFLSNGGHDYTMYGSTPQIAIALCLIHIQEDKDG